MDESPDAVTCTVALGPRDVAMLTYRSPAFLVQAFVMTGFLAYVAWALTLSSDAAYLRSDPLMLGLDALYLATLVYFFVSPFVLPRFGRRREMLELRTFTLDASGVHVRSRRAALDYEWSYFRRVTERGAAFTFWVNAREACVIPFRCLAPADVERIRQLARHGRPPKP